MRLRVPNELLLKILSYLSLESLIAARAASLTWRRFVDVADIHPARRGLLDLYLRVVNSPWFIRSRPWVLAHLRPFDREDYLHTLSQYRCQIPEEFAIWILEWPARAAFASKWPGLPDTEARSMFNPISRASGINNLGTLPPIVYTITYTDYTIDELTDKMQWFETEIPGLAICEETYGTKMWLLLDESEALQGKVLCSSSSTSFQREDSEFNVEYSLLPGWLNYLEGERQLVDKTYEKLPADFVTPPPSPDHLWNVDAPSTISKEWPKITDQ